MLLASAAGIALVSSARAGNNYVNTSPASGTSTLFTLSDGDTLTNPSSAAIAAGSQPAVVVGPGSAGTISNSGTIASFGAPGTAVSVGGTITTLTNSGTIAADTDGSTAIDIPAGGSIGALVDQASGTISANGVNGLAVNVLGNVGSIDSSGLVQATGSNGLAINLGLAGSVAAFSNSGTILASGTNGIALWATGQMGTLGNSGLIQGSTVGSDGGIGLLVDGKGTLAAFSNSASGTVASAGFAALAVFGSAGSVSNQGVINDAGLGYGVVVASGGSIAAFANLASGAVAAAASPGLDVFGSIGSVSNAGLILGGSLSAGVAVASGGSIAAFANLASGAVASDGYAGLDVFGSIGSVSNAGLIIGLGSLSAGVVVESGASIGTFANLASGTVVAATYAGLGVFGSLGSVSNEGLIVGGSLSAGVAVESGGSISSFANLAGGTVIATTYTGLDVFGSIGSVSNEGLIIGLGSLSAGVAVESGGSISSFANLAGGTVVSLGINGLGVFGSIGSVSNAGLIAGLGSLSAGVAVESGASIETFANLASGTVIATTYAGLDVFGSLGSVSNEGLIAGLGSLSAGVVVESGASIETFANLASGTVIATTYAGLDVFGSIGSVSNEGLIVGGSLSAGVVVGSGGSIAAFANLASGTVLAVTYAGLDVLGSLGSLSNEGLIAGGSLGAGVAVESGGSISSFANLAGGTVISLGSSGLDVLGSVGSLSNAGFIIGSLSIGVAVGVGGSIASFDNLAGGFVGSAGATALDVSGSIGSLSNAGTIGALGSLSAGVAVESGGWVASFTNLASGTVAAAGVGLDVSGSAGSVSNAGLLLGGLGAVSTGVRVETDGSIASFANLAGGTVASGGFAGIDVSGSLGSLSNAGLITAEGSNQSIGVAVEGGGSIASFANLAGGTLTSTGAAGLYVLGSVGTVANAGFIGDTGGIFGPGVMVLSGGSIGTFANLAGGTVTSSAIAILVAGSVGTVANAGIISPAGGILGIGLEIFSGGLVGSFTNLAGGTLASSGTALDVSGSAGTIANAGFIRADGGISSIGVAVESGGSVGSFVNLAGGTLASSGLAALEVSGSVGTLSNAGFIDSTGGSLSAGMAVASGGSVASFANLAGGTLASTGMALDVYGSVGTIANAGFIGSAGGSLSVGAAVESGGSIASFVNQAGGTIQATGPDGIGIRLATGGTIGSLANAGTIVGSVVGLSLNGAIPGGVSIGPSGLVQGGASDGSGTAIDNSAGAHLALTTAGRIVGGISLGAFGDTLTVTGGSITGSIGGSGTADSVVYALDSGGSIATGGPIFGIGTIGVASGSVNFLNSVSAAQMVNVGAGATAMLNPGAPIGAATFYNSGAVTIGSGSAAITGNYTQASAGVLRVTVTNASSGGVQVGQLGVSGSAVIQSTTNAVAASVPYTASIVSILNQPGTVLAAGTLATAGSLTASTDNVAVSFTLRAIDNALVLTAQLPTNYDLAVTTAAAEIDTWFSHSGKLYPPTANDVAARGFLAGLLARLSLAGNYDLVQSISQVLDPPSDLALAQFQRELLPTPLFAAAVNVAMSAGAFGTGASQIAQREQATLLEDTAPSAGNPAGRGIAAWAQPFGSFLTQNGKDGSDGYSVNTYGMALGGDTRITPQLRLGVAMTLANEDLSMNGLSSGAKGSTFTAQFGLYGVWHWNDFFVDGLLSYGHNSYSSTTPIPLFGLTKKAEYGGNQFGAKIGAGYNDTLPNNLVVTPYVSLEQMHLGSDGYTTTGAYPFNAHVAGQSVDLTQTSLGVRIAYPVKLSIGTLRPELHTNWFHTFGNARLTTTYTSADVATPGVFSFTAPSLDHDMFNIGVSAALLRSGPWRFAAGYDFNGRSSSSAHVVYLRARYDF